MPKICSAPRLSTFIPPCLKSAKNLYLSHRFVCKIRQIHRFFDVFRQNLQILCRNQARTQLPPSIWRETPSTSSVSAQETRHPHEMDTGLKLLSTSVHAPARPLALRARASSEPLLVLVEAPTSSNARLALVNLFLEKSNNTTLYRLWVLSFRVH